MTRTRLTHRIAYPLMAGCTLAVFTGPTGWHAVIIGLAYLLAAVVLLRPVDREPVVSVEDIYAESRRLHPSAWECENPFHDHWPEPEDGIAGRNDR